jgi:hypothetical protein
MNKVYKYPSIDQFYQIKRTVVFKTQCIGVDEQQQPILDESIKLPSIEYVGTVKLHGTNNSIVIRRDQPIVTQSRECIITPENDSYGFSKFAHNLPKILLEQFHTYCGGDCIIYGEFVGKGIQKGVGISQLDRSFFIFGAKSIITDKWINCSGLKCNSERIYNIYDYPTYNIVIDFNDPQKSLDDINKWTTEVEESCPISAALGLTGIGEGIVWSPVDPQWCDTSYRITFKTKGIKHDQHIKREATVDPIKSACIDEFIKKHVVTERLDQGITHLISIKAEITEKSTGEFIKWVRSDILKESIDELVQSKLNIKDINIAISTAARKWYFNKINQ